jgi:hypothetical protein
VRCEDGKECAAIEKRNARRYAAGRKGRAAGLWFAVWAVDEDAAVAWAGVEDAAGFLHTACVLCARVNCIDVACGWMAIARVLAATRGGRSVVGWAGESTCCSQATWAERRHACGGFENVRTERRYHGNGDGTVGRRIEAVEL